MHGRLLLLPPLLPLPPLRLRLLLLLPLLPLLFRRRLHHHPPMDEHCECTSTLVVFDPQANTWTELASMGTARHSHASSVICGKLYVFGGSSDEDDCIASVEAYDPTSNTWAYVLDLTSARGLFVAVAV